MTVDQTFSVRINGEERRIAGGTSIAGLIGELGLDAKRVAVERNLEIVPRSTFANVEVEDGDQYEIVHFVGGG
jgi:thiazole synthase